MSDFNEQLINEINSLRTDPKNYAKTISKYLNHFKEKLFYLPEKNIEFQTEEGVEAFKETIEFLEKQPELVPLSISKELSQIAEAYLNHYQNPDSNDLSDEDMEKIINKIGTFSGFFYRAISFGGLTPEMAVIDLIVSDGDSSRKQREVLLSNEIKIIGVANKELETCGHCSSIITCTEFQKILDKDEKEQPKENKELNENKKENIREPEEKKKVLEVVSVDKKENIVVEDGDKKKKTTVTKVMQDGSKQIAIVKEIFDE